MTAVAASTAAQRAPQPNGWMAPRQAVGVFAAFAAAYFLSALLRAVTATLAPVFSQELQLSAADLGLLAGAYFFGFAALQLPLGQALDRFGPKRTLLALLSLAVLGCAAFAMAQGLGGLVAARALIGMGVSACLMAPLTCFRRRFNANWQLRANSWMLMSGSLGMVASTLPVQSLLPVVGWRGLFWGLAAVLLVVMLALAWRVPADRHTPDVAPEPTLPSQHALKPERGYAAILRHPLFLRCAPMAVFSYGGLIGVQALWAGPWLTRVSGWSAQQAAQGLFTINLAMLVAFMAWGLMMPSLAARGWPALRVMAWGLPVHLVVLAMCLWQGPEATTASWALWCVASSVVTLSQPAVGAAFAQHMAGRALSAYNLLIFSGVFMVQWGVGVVVDVALSWGWPPVQAFRLAMAVLGAGSLLSYLWFLWSRTAVPSGARP